MDRASIIQRLGSIQNLPTLPRVVYELDRIVRDPNSNSGDVSKLIQDDPSMMSRILKVVNSSFYGFPREIDNIHQAVVLLGMEAVKNLALTTAVFTTFRKRGSDGLNRNEFWRHSVSVGIATRILYEMIEPKLSFREPRESLHLCGLVHDIGKIVFEQFFHNEFTDAINYAAEQNIPLYQGERALIGIDHAEVGAWMARKWNLPAKIEAVAHWHHAPDGAPPEFRPLAHICHIANYICNQEKLGFSGTLVPAFEQSFFLSEKGVTIEAILDTVSHIRSEAAESEVLLALAS